jgi:hypothetical protein
MAGLDPAAHANTAVENKTWVAGSSPAMTKKVVKLLNRTDVGQADARRGWLHPRHCRGGGNP